jgi:hypothetical protein
MLQSLFGSRSRDASVSGLPPSAVTLNANGISLNVTEKHPWNF